MLNIAMYECCFKSSAISKLKETASIYVYGTLGVGIAIARALLEHNLPFAGFIDSYNYGKTIQIDEGEADYKIYHIDKLADKQAAIFISSVVHYLEIHDSIVMRGFNNIIDPISVLDKGNCPLDSLLMYVGHPIFWMPTDWAEHKDKYEWLKRLLADEKSVAVFKTIMDVCVLHGWSDVTHFHKLFAQVDDKIELQYEEFMQGDIFVDGGSYDATTAKAFIKLNPNYKKVYLVEPNPASMKVCKASLDGYSNIEYLPYGLSDSKKTLKFNADDEQVASFSENGNISVNCMPLDMLVQENTAMIKLDVEGSELEAIAGAKRLLTNGSPFAICVYHKSGDIWRIPEQILKLNPNYKLYLRHYGPSSNEIVLFGV
ncbi:hypothetical protein RsTz2092_07560 [Deferribacterales bacterium RsTz2092]|nr:hypothetical protein AGMMS49941_01510 [Deferribacterales bacterium]